MQTPATEHLLRFVSETGTTSAPWAGLEEELTTEVGVLISDLMEAKSEPEDEEIKRNREK